MKSLPMFLDVIGRYVNTKKLFSSFNKNKGRQLNSLVKFWKDMFSNLDHSKLLKDLVIIANSKLKEIELEIIEEFKYPQLGEEDYFEPIYKHIDKMTYKTALKIVDEIFVDDSNYMTIHRSKGKEFNSVMVNGEPFAKEKEYAQVLWVLQNPVILSESLDTNARITEEYTRLLYVGYSRAINKLYIHLYGDENTAVEIDKKLNPYIDNGIIFYEFEYC